MSQDHRKFADVAGIIGGLTGVLLLAGCAVDQSRSNTSGEGSAPSVDAAAWQAEARAWRQRRYDRLTEPYGWLSLVGLDFVADGRWRIGAADDADITMPTGPDLWGELVVDGTRARFEPASDAVRVDGRRGVAGMLVRPGRDEPVWVQAEDARFQIIERNGRLAVRTRWPRAETRTEFKGLDYFPFAPEWRVEARFEYNPPGSTMPVGSVLGDITQEPNLGAAVFEYEGETYRLEAQAASDDDELFFVFADRTTGRETYGAGRMLYAPMPDEDGRTVLDFNRAYNPPCTFTEFSTCPLPVPENRLDVRVTAGEKDYAGEKGYLR
ncbi:MAG: DUF1684 domain-containing protein [Gammaproteobacteria bacterium]|nr:DUF1684 domain-containing protein [Gammaproteobacteria bacterium]